MRSTLSRKCDSHSFGFCKGRYSVQDIENRHDVIFVSCRSYAPKIRFVAMDLVSPQPFWPLRNGLLSVYPSLKEDVTCDVVVLGAGISGAFVAECLSREGLDIVVLDKRDVGGGSTSASTALLQYEIDMSLVELSKRIGRRDAEECYRLCHDSIDTIERLVAKLRVECVFQRRKSVSCRNAW